jgi:hypothetical protein
LIGTANFVPISTIIVTLRMEDLSSSETSVITKAICSNVLEEGILHSHRSEYLKSNKIL